MSRIKQHVPHLDFGDFSLGSIKNLFDKNEIFINSDYQRSDVWKISQQISLMESIFNSYSIGVLVLYKNDKKQFEVLDGQQRLLTINKYLNNNLDVYNSKVEPYENLSNDDKNYLDAYSVYYLEIKSNNKDDVVQTFLRLQEGTPLNKAEKINAHRGEFKNIFRKIKDNHELFHYLGDDKRFRLRLLSAEFLHLELESDFNNLIFPGLDIKSLLKSCEKYKNKVSKRKTTFLKGNLDILQKSLGPLLTGIKSREIIPFYLLVSYLRKNKGDNSNLSSELAIFFEEFMREINSFSIYDTIAPKEMNIKDFNNLLIYKTEARKATSSDSIKFRFEFLKKEFKKKNPYIEKDKERLHAIDQKRILFFRQKSICPECDKPIDFNKGASAHHEIAHKDGGKTDDLNNSKLLHMRCHVILEKRLKKQKSK